MSVLSFLHWFDDFFKNGERWHWEVAEEESRSVEDDMQASQATIPEGWWLKI